MNLQAARHFARIASVLALLSLPAGCNRSQGSGAIQTPIQSVPSGSALGSAPLGQIAGSPTISAIALSTANPYQGDSQSIQQGQQLYLKMNCAGCHAYNGKGNMGPDLTDRYWRYGGLPIQIYQSISEGRPQGMPSWGAALPPNEIWKLVAYIQSFGGSFSVLDYEHARQGDEPGEQIAPEAQADAYLAPPAQTATASGAPGASEPVRMATPRKAGEAKP
jgi:cytochrome c oxidase cbb3-type subunit 3